MYKQKQLVYCGSRSRPKCCSRHEKSHKKNLQILQTYVVSPPKTHYDQVYQVVAKQKLPSPKTKRGDQYLIINPPKTRYNKHIKTQAEDPQDFYVTELKSLRSDIKSLQKQIQQKKASERVKEQEDQYMTEIKNLKSQLLEIKTLQKEQKEVEEIKAQRHFYQDQYLTELQDIKSQIKDLQKDLKDRKTFLPPIVINPPVPTSMERSLNPQTLGKSRQKNHKKGHILTRRSHTVAAQHPDQLEELKDQVRQLRRQLTLDKRFKNKQLPSLSKLNPQGQLYPQEYMTSPMKEFVRNNFSQHKLDSIYVADPRMNSAYNKGNSKRKFNGSELYGQLPQKGSEIKRDQMNETSMSFKSWKKHVLNSGIRKLKKACNAVYFVYNLQRFAQRIRMKRQNFFRDSFEDSIFYAITQLKQAFVKSAEVFTKTLPINQGQLLLMLSSDTEKQRATKVDLTRKYLNGFLDIIRETQFLPEIMKTLTETCYFVCRHGSAGVLSNYFTSEELDIMCISKASLKVCAERNLEKSHILSFLWIKLVVFNVLLRAQAIKEIGIEGKPIWITNFYLFGSLIYQISRQYQASLIQKVPISYVIGNWKHINFLNSKNSLSKKAINPSKSMVIVMKQYEKTLKIQETPHELIQGTISKTFLADAYGYESWQPQQKKIANYVNLVHRRICQYHSKMKEEMIG